MSKEGKAKKPKVQEQLREFKELVEEHEAFLSEKGLEQEFAEFQKQREQDMELEEEQFEEEPGEEEGEDEDYNPAGAQ